MEITITAEIVSTARRIRKEHNNEFFVGYSCNCPFALALLMATGRLWSVANITAHLVMAPSVEIMLPAEVVTWIDSWDGGWDVPIPFSVDLPVPKATNGTDQAH